MDILPAGYLIVTNAPPSAAIGWNIVKRFLDPKVAEKISILSGPAHDFLRNLYGEKVLPVEYGGTNPFVIPHAIHKSAPGELDKRFPIA